MKTGPRRLIAHYSKMIADLQRADDGNRTPWPAWKNDPRGTNAGDEKPDPVRVLGEYGRLPSAVLVENWSAVKSVQTSAASCRGVQRWRERVPRWFTRSAFSPESSNFPP